MKSKNKTLRFVIIIIAALIALTGAGAAVFFIGFDPYSGTVSEFAASKELSEVLTAEEAVSDLDYMYNTITQKHPAWLEDNEMPLEVKAGYEKERAFLLEKDSVTVLELWQSSSRMFAALSDGHTRVGVNLSEKMYIDKLFELPESELSAVDGKSAEDLMTLFKSMYFYEDAVEFYAEQEFRQRILRREYLELLGIDTSDGVVLSFEDGKTLDCGFITEEQALALQGEAEESTAVSSKIDAEHSLGILTLNECTVDDEYLSVLGEFFNAVISQNIKNVAGDLRANGGGNSNVINEFLKYIDVGEYKITGGVSQRQGPFLLTFEGDTIKNEKKSEVFGGRLFVLTSADTFSSAMLFAETVSDNKLGEIIGEIPGNMPESYGDILSFQTPCSGIIFTVSYKHFLRIDSEKAEEAVLPDFCVAAEDAEKQLYSLLQQ